MCGWALLRGFQCMTLVFMRMCASLVDQLKEIIACSADSVCITDGFEQQNRKKIYACAMHAAAAPVPVAAYGEDIARVQDLPEEFAAVRRAAVAAFLNAVPRSVGVYALGGNQLQGVQPLPVAL